MREELKPCPFCGGKASLDEKGCYDLGNKVIYAYCLKCDSEGKKIELFKQGNREKVAIKAWNKRTKTIDEPEFKVGDEVWIIKKFTNKVEKDKVRRINITYDAHFTHMYAIELHKTREEAEAALSKLEGE